MILDLFKKKKHFLSEFAQLGSVELKRFQNHDFSHLESFYNSRESLLELIKYIDQKIEDMETSEDFKKEQRSQRFIENKAPHLDLLKVEMKVLTQEILKKDLEILSLIDREKSLLIKDIQSVRKNKKHVSSYKTKVGSHQIDEEA